VEGCDSIVTTQVFIHKPVSSVQFVEACESFFWNGKTYTESGDFSIKAVGSNGCDSTAILKLKIKNPTVKYFDTTACLNFSWRGRLLRATGIYRDTLVNTSGCDSILVLRLKVTQPVLRDTIVKSCSSVKWNGKVYDQSGEYKFTFLSSLGCDSTVVLKLIIQKPKTAFYADDSTKCFNDHRFTFVNQSSSNMGARTFKWLFASTDSSSNESPQYSFKSVGKFQVTLITNFIEFGCKDTTTRWVNILPNPSKPVLAVIGKSNICEGETTYLFAGDNVAYRWYKDGLLMEGDSSKVIKPFTSGLYTVSGIDRNGCKGLMSDPAIIVVNKRPLAPNVVKREYMYCIGANASPLESEVNPGSTMVWYLPGKGDTTDYVVPIPSTAKSGIFYYYVKSTTSKGCESPLVKIVVNVGTIRKPEIQWINNQLQSDSGYTSYDWIVDGKLIGNGKKHIFKPTIAGLYRVKVSNDFGCIDTSFAFNLVVTAINGGSLNNVYASMQVYPNPFRNKVVVDAGERPTKEYTIRVYDARGKTITTVLSKRQVTELNTAGMTSGQYMVEISEGTKRKTVRIVKSE
jgi:hypothetical protein